MFRKLIAVNISPSLTRHGLLAVKDYNIMAKKKALPSFPVYLPKDKYDTFKALCETERMPMTKIAEQEIDKFIKRKTFVQSA